MGPGTKGTNFTASGRCERIARFIRVGRHHSVPTRTGELQTEVGSCPGVWGMMNNGAIAVHLVTRETGGESLVAGI